MGGVSGKTAEIGQIVPFLRLKMEKMRVNVLYNIKITIFAAEIKSVFSMGETDFQACLTKNKEKMLKEKAGEIAGKIWNALNETEGLTAKQIKKLQNWWIKICSWVLDDY